MKGQRIRYQQTGEFHFLTFSSFRRRPYLSTVAAMELFEDALERIRLRYLFAVAGYVVMPEHVHLLVNEPVRGLLSRTVQALKLSVSMRSRERPFWQAHYYDFNVSSHQKFVEKLRYIHRNPIKRGLVAKPEQWPWSSYRHYQTGMRGTVEIESEWTARERGSLPGPQKRGTGGTLNLIMRGMRPGPPAAQYDLNGNLSQFTDRKTQVTTYTYDGLNRATNVRFADGSTVANTFDAGNRLTGVTDSITGAISHTYDGLDHLLSETTPQGSVAYTYDADERRQTMTVSGQVPVSYSYNNASRLTSIVQGASNVGFAYDSDGRRSSLSLPNGVLATYNYDAAAQLTGIVYQGGALAPANLAYSYDLAGRRVGVSGSLASAQLPAAVSSAVYNANNQLTQWGSTAMTYDANGNTAGGAGPGEISTPR